MTNPCSTCGADLAAEARFCESCGSAIAGAPAPAATPVAVADEVAPISAPTYRRAVDELPPPGPRPCLQCGADVGADGYCVQCGAKAPSERDHFREQPATWVAGVCDRGITHSRNEDAMALNATAAVGERAVLVVLDGVSNSIDSDVASLAGARAARDVLRTPLPQGMGTPQGRSAAITKVIDETVTVANKAVIAATDPASPNPASATFAVAILEGSTLVHANVGDSRVYWLPDAGDGVQLSLDHSGAQAQMEAGIAREVAENSQFAHAITRWLGRDSEDHTPHVGQLQVAGPGWVMVCSDGLWNYASTPAELRAQVVAAGVEDPEDPAALALALVAFANGRGGRDNITVALARVPAPAVGHNDITENPQQGESVG